MDANVIIRRTPTINTSNGRRVRIYVGTEVPQRRSDRVREMRGPK